MRKRSAPTLLTFLASLATVGYPLRVLAQESATAGDGAQPAGPPAAAAAPPPEVEAPTPLLVHEPYFTTGAGFYESLRRLLAGGGGGIGYRLNIGRFLSLYAEGRVLIYTGSVYTGASGIAVRLPIIGSWEPLVGLQAAVFAGQRIEFLASDQTRFGAPVVWAGQLRLYPLRFAKKTFSASALGGDWGYGSDSGLLGTAFSINLVEVALRF